MFLGSVDPEFEIAGSCDECGSMYDAGSRDDHCPECGTCWVHCPNNHTPESIQALDHILMMSDDFD